MSDFVLYSSIIAVVFILVLVGLFLWRGKKRIYKPKGDFLLSAGETYFFEALQKSITPAMYICPKVRIADLVEMAIDAKDKDFWPKFNKISQKHVDFVVCRRKDFHPLFIVELDGGSHHDQERSLRDMLVDDVFNDAEIPMLHFPVQHEYDIDDLTRQIKKVLSHIDETEKKL